MSHKALELLTLHADKGLSNGVVHLFAVFDVVHVPQGSDLANSNVKRKSENPDVDFTIIGSSKSSYRFKLVSWKRFDEGSHITLHSRTVVGLAELLQFSNTVFAHTKNLKPLDRKWFQRDPDEQAVHQIPVLVSTRSQCLYIIVMFAFVHDHPAEGMLPGSVQVRLQARDRRQILLNPLKLQQRLHSEH